MAFARVVFQRGIKFPESVGGVRGSNIHGEEQVVSRRIRNELGLKIMYDPEAFVLHKVYRSRLGVRQIWKNSFGIGRTRKMVFELSGNVEALSIERSVTLRMIRDGILALAGFWFHPRRSSRVLGILGLVFFSAVIGYFSAASVVHVNGIDEFTVSDGAGI